MTDLTGEKNSTQLIDHSDRHVPIIPGGSRGGRSEGVWPLLLSCSVRGTRELISSGTVLGSRGTEVEPSEGLETVP